MSENFGYGLILDKGECLSTIDGDSRFNWRSSAVKELAGKSEWERYGFYPRNGMVGPIVDRFFNPVFNFNIYVLEIDERFFVPMSEKGIEIISSEKMQELLRNDLNFSGAGVSIPKQTRSYIGDAPFYCEGALIAISRQMNADSNFRNHTNSMIERIRSENHSNVDPNELFTTIAKFTGENVKADRDDWNDLNSVAWHMGIMCYVYHKSLNLPGYSFNDIFHSSWCKYFETNQVST